MSQTIRLRMTRPYAAYKSGEVVECEHGLAERLLAWGYATREQRQPLIETATAEPVVESADITPRRKGRRHE